MELEEDRRRVGTPGINDTKGSGEEPYNSGEDMATLYRSWAARSNYLAADRVE